VNGKGELFDVEYFVIETLFANP